jgi:hypothetical protein
MVVVDVVDMAVVGEKNLNVGVDLVGLSVVEVVDIVDFVEVGWLGIVVVDVVDKVDCFRV